MLNYKYHSRGVTLIELMVAMVVVVALLAVAAPNFSQWIQNTKIRNTTEILQNGLNLAKSEAVHQNTTARLGFCGSANGGASAWDLVIASTPSATTTAQVCQADAANSGWVRVQRNPLQAQDITTLTTNIAAVAPDPPLVAFNGWGRVVGAASATLDIGLNNGNCATLRCLRIQIAPGGRVRMCDPNLPAGTPQGC